MATTASKKRSLDDLGLQNPYLIAKRTKSLKLEHVPKAVHLQQHDGLASQSDSDLSSSSLSPSTVGTESDTNDVTSSSPSSSSESTSENNHEQSDEEDESMSSTTSSSSSSPGSLADEITDITTLRVPCKPPITSTALFDTPSDLRSRLSIFLPTLAAANDELEIEREAGTLQDRNIEDVDEEGYIEMDLGLGVLEETKLDGSESDSSSDSESGGEGKDDDNDGERQAVLGGRGAEGDVLGKLLGRKNRKVGIQVVDSE
ncbi:MAG: hypothetical protein M1830_000390 [Pleopsidium flavum]|nr:MAG: hypothetical protein M1830_000390 [Pleopsidium flavum]